MAPRKGTAAPASGTVVKEGAVFEGAATPYQIGFRVKGVRDFLFSKPDLSVFDKGNQKTKPRDDYEKMVWRLGEQLAVPSNAFLKALSTAARGFNDPTKSGHKSMTPVVPIAMQPAEELCGFVHRNGRGDIAVTEWDSIDERIAKLRATMGPARRPKLLAGWETTVHLNVVWAHIFAPADVASLMNWAGGVGIGDGIKIGFGRFVVTKIEDPVEIAWT